MRYIYNFVRQLLTRNYTIFNHQSLKVAYQNLLITHPTNKEMPRACS